MKVSWDDYSPIYEKITNVPNHQPAMVTMVKYGKLWRSIMILITLIITM
jgi:hypothetical protein